MSYPALTYPAPATVLELLKPITWFAPMWAFLCGLVSINAPLSERWGLVIAGTLLAGPLVCGTSQAVNDWFDRHVDAINEPDRPIPSGRMPGRWGFYIACMFTAFSLALGFALGEAVFFASIFGLILAWAYSAPPFRLKLNGWAGNAAVGLCYEGLPWFTGAAVMGGTLPSMNVIALALLYSIGAHGIMTLNDFKSVEGDTHMGVASLPVQLGVMPAAKLACVVMALPQMGAIALLLSWQQPIHAAIVGLLLLLQGVLMIRLLKDPRKYAAWYNATGTSAYVLGMMACAFALRDLTGVMP
jgi:chlorophyll synthase